MTSPTMRATTGSNGSATTASGAARLPHPPFSAIGPGHMLDYSTKTGAHALADMIRDAWRRCGHDVPVNVEPVQPGNPQTTYTVRMPTLIRGLPR